MEMARLMGSDQRYGDPQCPGNGGRGDRGGYGFEDSDFYRFESR